jgi:MFS family permease
MSSYQNQTADTKNNKNLYDNSDLYEYDTEGKQPGTFISNAAGRVRSLFSGGDDAGNQNFDSDNASMRYKRDFLDSLCANINQTLIVPKAFYFFYFAAFGSLFPLMGIYFKQMAMTSLQVGILLGFRPFVEFISAPFWASVGERWRKGRIILLGSMLCWIIFTLAMGFIKVPAHSCTFLNETDVIIEKSRNNIDNNNNNNNVKKREIYYSTKMSYLYNQDFLENEGLLMFKQKRQAESSKVYEIQRYSIVSRMKKNRTTTATTTTTTTITTATAATTIKQRKIRPNPSLEEGISNVIDKVLDKPVEISLKTQPNNEVVNETINNVLEEIAEDIKNATKKIEISKKPIEPIDVLNKFTDKVSGGKGGNDKQKENYFGTPPTNIDKELVKPKLKTSIVYNKKDVRRVFFVFLFLLLAGEFVCAPAITIADSCTLQYLGPTRSDLYGRQRMFGSIGWALAMFVIGLLLDQSKAFTEHPCGQAGPDERNYNVCFAIYSVLMGCAFVIATQFKFSYGDSEQIPLKQIKQKAKDKLNRIRDPRFKQFDRQQLVNEDDGDNDYNVIDAEMPPPKPPIHEGYINTGFVEINDSESRKKKYKRLLETCRSAKHMSFLFIVWFMGIGVGLVFTFLFWHLQGNLYKVFSKIF